MLVEVAVPLPVHGRFTWNTPDPLGVGATVLVPYGSRKVVGWVVGPGEAPAGVAIKSVERVLDPNPAFSAEQLKFFRWIADYYLSPLGEVIATAIPSDSTASTRRVYVPTADGIELLATSPPEGERGAVLREVVARPGCTKSGLERRLHGEVDALGRHLTALQHAALIAGEDRVVEGVKDEVVWLERVAGGESPALRCETATKQADPAAASAASAETPPATGRKPLGPAPKLSAPAQALLDRLPCLLADAAGPVATLVERGLAQKVRRPRLAPIASGTAVLPPPLNPAQLAAVAAVGSTGVYLLHGVTGAGKTEVYLALAETAVRAGKQVLVLVPEIVLTPQLCARFAARFPGKVAVVHSGVSAGEKVREWRRVRAGEASVVVGARSALFAPFAALGLVVVDEEHDDSYKQDEGVRYHGRDVAVVLANRAGCPCVLGSATPSLESYQNALGGRYRLLELLERATASPVPTLEMVDLRALAKANGGKSPLLAPEVEAAVHQALAQGGKAILLHNRRGYATFVECSGCGGTYDCPSCSVALVLHQGAQRLDCHYCGFHRTFPKDCPQCGDPLSLLGRGTERVEEQLCALFPDVPVARMDADTTKGKGAHARILSDFRDGKSRLLIGTQLVAKGHDFPDVHVAAVLGADHVLGMPDFRSAERTWALVTQLCGRAGRGNVAGRVFVQSQHPEHPVFSCVGDMASFASNELDLRRMLAYPPFSSLVLMRIESADKQVARDTVATLVRQARAESRAYPGVDVLGPAAAPLPRLVGRYRFQIVLRGRDRRSFRTFLSAHHKGWLVPAGVRRIIDVDPRSMM